jgi:hypothetical protein
MTAVEWLVQQTPNMHWEDDYWAYLFERAKEMEKQQQGYTEDEVLDIIRQYALEEHLITSSKPDAWFEQFKKIR